MISASAPSASAPSASAQAAAVSVELRAIHGSSRSLRASGCSCDSPAYALSHSFRCQRGCSVRPTPAPVPRCSTSLSGIKAAHDRECIGPALTQEIEPEYPPEARASGVEGDVLFRIIIGRAISGENSKIKEIHLRRGKPMLIKAAAEALADWQYRPFILNGEALEVESFATIRFRLPVGKVDSFRAPVIPGD